MPLGSHLIGLYSMSHEGCLSSEHPQEIVIVLSQSTFIYRLGGRFIDHVATNQKEDVGRMVEPPRPAGYSDLFPCCH